MRTLKKSSQSLIEMSKESIYWLIVLMTFIYIILKNKNNLVKITIILCFYAGLASFFGRVVENTYKVVLVLLSLYILYKYNGLSQLGKRTKYLLVVFMLFSASFFFSALLNGDYFNLTLSQYGKYVTPICLFFVLQRILNKNPLTFIGIKGLFFSLLTVQVILSFAKILTIGIREYTVGSISNIGGGIATMVPVLGFILIWLDQQGNVKRKDWIYIILLIFISFTSLKRAIWFILPIVIILFMYYVPKRLKISNLINVLPLALFIFYIGMRLNPTLNKEGKIGGSFDLNFVLEYNKKYSFGQTAGSSEIQSGTGRGGATYLLFHKLFDDQSLSFQDYWGSGLKEVYTTNYEEFNEKKYNLNSKGSVAGIFQSYIASGYVGVFVTLLFIISVCSLIKETRIRNTITLLILWDYFFYIGLILRSQSMFVLLFFIILYSNFQIEQRSGSKYSVLIKNGSGRDLKLRTLGHASIK